MKKTQILAISILVVVLFLCCCFATLALKTIIEWGEDIFEIKIIPSEPQSQESGEIGRNGTVLEDDVSVNPSLDPGARETLQTLKISQVPENDPYGLAQRFRNIEVSPQPFDNPPVEYRLGDRRSFWVLNTDTNKYRQTTAVLQYITSHAYFWIEEGATFDQAGLENLANAFEYKIYPTNRDIFGSERTPGIDNDPHLIILYAFDLGGAAGYFSSTDTVPSAIEKNSNEAEMFYLSADYVHLGSNYSYSILAHEFQHMIHWNHDRNETAWISEGFSELASLLNGYDPGSFDYLFAIQPDLQLTDWPGNDQGDSSPHYGAAYLFMKYFLDRFGDNATQALVQEPTNDMDSVDLILSKINEKDTNTNQVITADDVFRDWTLTNYMQDPKVGDGRYQYQDIIPPTFSPQENMICGDEEREGTVKQYGTDYIELLCSEDFTLKLSGQKIVKVFPEDPLSGDYYFWSNKGDESDMTLSRDFDFTNTLAPIWLEYSVWYDIEKDYDYLYLIVSEDGRTWQIIETPSCTKDDPTGANFGCGYSGRSAGWANERVDLSKYAGKKITLQFEYVTDLAVNGEGLVIDDVSIPSIGYSSDFESDEGGWSSSGFVRIQNKLPQTYLITLITKGDQIQVTPLSMDDNNQLTLPVELSPDVESYILVISGSTRYTRMPAEYRYQLINNQK